MKNITIAHQQPLETLAPIGKVGLVALATDFNLEHDLRRMYPEGVEVFTSRVLNVNPLTVENLRTMTPKISEVAATLLPNTPLDVVIYGCTSGTAAIGADNIRQLIQQSCPEAVVINPLDAACAALEHVKAKRLSILTPYTESVNAEVADSLQQRGFEVLNMAGFGYEDDTIMTFIAPDDLTTAAIEIVDPTADAVFISCTSLRASLAIESIEKQLNKPVISSNQALVWQSLKQLGYDKPIDGFGTLLRDY